LNAKSKPYYFAYEKRYQAVYASGATLWGHTPDDEILIKTLAGWVTQNNLQGKRVVEYACGEGSVGVILSRLGCQYHGIDIAPSAIERAKQLLFEYPFASISLLDMVTECMDGEFDAAIDVSGLHMLITDTDRKNYLENVNVSLTQGAPALFFRESFSKNAYSGKVSSIAEWKTITGDDFETPDVRLVINNGITYSVNIPLIPARAKNKADYITEMTESGFIVDQFIDMDPSREIWNAASIYVHKDVRYD